LNNLLAPVEHAIERHPIQTALVLGIAAMQKRVAQQSLEANLGELFAQSTARVQIKKGLKRVGVDGAAVQNVQNTANESAWQLTGMC